MLQTAAIFTVALFLSALGTDAANAVVDGYYTSLVNADPTVFCGSTALYNTSAGGLVPQNTQTYGSRLRIGGVPNSLGMQNSLMTPYRMNTLSEIFVAMATMQLDADGELSIDKPILTQQLPPALGGGGAAGGDYFYNPAFPRTPITIRHLLQHTSTINEVGFFSGDASTPVAAGVSSLNAFVEKLFADNGDDVFETASPPGYSTSFLFSRTNIALLSYLINQVLAPKSIDIGTYIMNTLLPDLGLSSTFILTPKGIKPNPAYPAGMDRDWLDIVAVQDVQASGTETATSRTITPAYTADYMFYTTTEDLLRLVSVLLTPSGALYNSIGSRILENAVAVNDPNLPYVTHRANGVYLMDRNKLCEEMTAAVKPNTAVPYCNFNELTSRPGDNTAAAYGLFSSGSYNQVSVLCVKNEELGCGVSSISYNEDPARMLTSTQRIVNMGVGMAMATIAEFSVIPFVEPTTTTTTQAPVSPPPPPEESRLNANFGMYVFLGVLATILVVLLSSYIADYLIQPAPPPKVVVPVPTLPQAAAEGPAGGDGMGGGMPPQDDSMWFGHRRYTNEGGSDMLFARSPQSIVLGSMGGPINSPYRRGGGGHSTALDGSDDEDVAVDADDDYDYEEAPPSKSEAYSYREDPTGKSTSNSQDRSSASPMQDPDNTQIPRFDAYI